MNSKKLGPYIGPTVAVIISLLVATGVIGAHAQEANTRFNVSIEGHGQTILFIPGLTSSPTAFKNALVSPLKAQAHWVTLAGFAGVPAPENLDAFTIPAAAALNDYMIKNELTGVSLVGHSMGGVISLLIAAEAPDRIDRILIVDSVPFLAGLFQPGANPEDMAGRKAPMRAQFDAMSAQQFSLMMKQGLPRQATSQQSQELVWADIEKSDKRAVAIATAEIFTTDYRSILPKITAKVTVLVPHNNFLGSSPEQIKERYKVQYEGLKNVEFHVIEDSRHFIMLDQPDIFAAELERFLK